MPIDKSLLTGSTTMLILKLLEESDMYGYQMIEALTRKSNNVFELKAGTLYPLLHTLEQKKWVTSYEETADSARVRKYYSITKGGLKHLHEKQEEWRTYTSAVNQVLGVRSMQPSDKMKGYIETARQQIRWKRAQPVILTEIQNHILDQKDAYVQDGLDEEAATDRAILDMGDPVVVGQQLDRVHRPKPDWLLIGLTGLLFIAGYFIQQFFGFNQLPWIVAGILIMVATYFIDFTILGKYPKVIFYTLCCIILFMFLYRPLLLLFPVAFAGLVYSKRNHGYAGLILCGVIYLVFALLSLWMSLPIVMVLLCLSCSAILAGAVIKGWFRVRKWLALFILFMITAVLITLLFGGTVHEQKYMQNTVSTFLNHSQVWGNGLSVDPDAEIGLKNNTDYLLTSLIYRHGWIVLIGVLTVFTAFFARAFIKCIQQKNVLGVLVSLAIVSILAIQCASYIALNTGLLYFDPLPLPFLSRDSGALIVDALLIGLLLSVFRTGSLVRDKAAEPVAVRERFFQDNHGRMNSNLYAHYIFSGAGAGRNYIRVIFNKQTIKGREHNDDE